MMRPSTKAKLFLFMDGLMIIGPMLQLAIVVSQFLSGSVAALFASALVAVVAGFAVIAVSVYKTYKIKQLLPQAAPPAQFYTLLLGGAIEAAGVVLYASAKLVMANPAAASNMADGKMRSLLWFVFTASAVLLYWFERPKVNFLETAQRG